MSMRFTQLQCKEVICVKDGRRLGYVEDVMVEVPEGNVCSLVVPPQSKALGVLPCREEYVIPWSCVRRIGPDIVLVETKPEECRCPRSKPRGGLRP